MYAVTYASAGCLPENDPEVFNDLDEAAEYVVNRYNDVAGDDDSADPIHAHVVKACGGFKDPTPDSLYRWTIEKVD